MGDLNQAMLRNSNDPAAVQARAKAANRANVLQLKLIGASHPTGLTANLLRLFEARPPLEFKPPVEKRKNPSYSGIGSFVSHFAEPGDPEYAPPVEKVETKAEKKARIQKDKLEKGAAKAAEELQKYDPNNDPNVTGDPFKTLFVAKINYETPEHRLRREFESYGPIKRVRMVTDKETNKPRGYAFIEYMHTRDMKNAYKQADGRKVDNKRLLVDVERGRTVPNWRPRRLGGGLGSSRMAAQEVPKEQPAASSARPKSEEPRNRGGEDREREREKSREREKEKERERERERDRARSREKSHDRERSERERTRERDDKHRDRDRDRERDRERGDRDRTRDKDRERGRDRDREREKDRGDKDREKERGRDRGRESRDRDRDRHRESRGRDRDRDERDRHAAAEPKYEADVTMVDPHGRDERHGYDNYNYDYNQQYTDIHNNNDNKVKNEKGEYGGGMLNKNDEPEEGEAFDEGDYRNFHHE